MRKVAHYFYDGGKELVVFVENRVVTIQDQHGQDPICPIRRVRYPYPGSAGDPDGADQFGVELDYETLGLYYNYGMSGTGWDGDC